MVYEFAITPELFDASVINAENESEKLIEILRAINDNGGILADLNKGGWAKYVRQKMDTLPQKQKDRFLKLLTKLKDRNRLVRHQKGKRPPSTDQDWLKLALNSHEKIPFHAIILSEALKASCDKKCDNFFECDNFLDSDQREKLINATLTCPFSYDKYKSAFAPVLRYAKCLTIIDPYMHLLNPECSKIITICSELLGKRRPKHGKFPETRIVIHAQDSGVRENLSYKPSDWEKKLKPLSSKYDHIFKVYLWKREAKKLHARYILTNQCGILSSESFCCKENPNSDDNGTWSLIGRKRQEQLEDEYDPSTQSQDAFKEITVEPNKEKVAHRE